MNKFSIFTVLGMIAIFGILAGIKASQFMFMGSQMASFSPPPSVVNSVEVESGLWESVVYAPGELEAENGVIVSAQLEGNVEDIKFTPGSIVQKGDILITQDLTSENTQLASAKSAQVLAEKNLERAQPLLSSKDISQEDFDVIVAQYQQAVALVKNVESTIAKKNIVAPFDGRLGISQIDQGQYLRAGDPIVSLQDISTILVNFSLPQRELSRVKLGQSIRVAIDSSEQTFVGKVSVISPLVDAQTRNIRLQAEVDNSDESLKPGMFVDVELVVSEGDPVIKIPVSSVLNAPYGDSVFIIEAGELEDENVKKIRQTFVRLGRSRGDFVDVVEGLEAGQRVVSSGLFKLFNGQNVVEDNSLSPKFELDPQLKDS